MRPLTRALFVLVLTLNASGIIAFVVPEPCSILEAGNANDETCPPTCTRCGCCAQPAVVSLSLITASVASIESSATALPSDALASVPRDILHVPKR